MIGSDEYFYQREIQKMWHEWEMCEYESVTENPDGKAPQERCIQ
jgi:hypothetical protein